MSELIPANCLPLRGYSLTILVPVSASYSIDELGTTFNNPNFCILPLTD